MNINKHQKEESVTQTFIKAVRRNATIKLTVLQVAGIAFLIAVFCLYQYLASYAICS